jgi:aspartyl-tRNA synthetase
MTFVEQEDILFQFEAMIQHLLKKIKGVELGPFPRMTFTDAIQQYGNDKPDIRFGMAFGELNELAQNRGFNVFDSQELVVGIAVPGGASMSRKEIDNWIDLVKQPQIGATGLVWVKCNEDGSYKSTVDKFFGADDLTQWAEATGARAGDLIFVMAGAAHATRKQLSALRMEIAEQMGLRKADEFAAVWVTDFPLLEWDEDNQRYHAMHHPFTAPKKEDIGLLDSDPVKAKANAYDLVLNGNEIGGGSIRIHDKSLQEKMFNLLGFSEQEAIDQFGFLMDALQFGAPPHGGIALGLDRLVAILGGSEIIRDFIAFPKNNGGRDVMIDAPAALTLEQLEELSLKTLNKKTS